MAALKIVAALAALGVVGVLVAAAFRPDTFEVRRSLRIAAPADRIQPLIADLREFNTWNPFNKKDPQIRGSYRGPHAGPGATYEFAGNGEVGSGVVQVTAAAIDRVGMTLDMTRPMKAHHLVDFTLQARGAETEVTWAMRGATPYLGKILHMVFDMDKMVGGSFEAGLADLKKRAEGGAR